MEYRCCQGCVSFPLAICEKVSSTREMIGQQRTETKYRPSDWHTLSTSECRPSVSFQPAAASFCQPSAFPASCFCKGVDQTPLGQRYSGTSKFCTSHLTAVHHPCQRAHASAKPSSTKPSGSSPTPAIAGSAAAAAATTSGSGCSSCCPSESNGAPNTDAAKSRHGWPANVCVRFARPTSGGFESLPADNRGMPNGSMPNGPMIQQRVPIAPPGMHPQQNQQYYQMLAQQQQQSRTSSPSF
jgi:hypothetical protein